MIDTRERCRECGQLMFDRDAHDKAYAEIASLTSRLEAAEKEKEASDLADDLWHAAEVRGIAMWREAHPGKELNLPDAAQYTFWLIHEVEETRAARDAATAERDEALQAASVLANENRRLRAALTPAPSKEGDGE